MARKPRGKQAENLGKYAGANNDKEEIEKLSAAAKKNNTKAGHNAEPTSEVLDRNFDSIERALLEIAAAGRIMQKARAGLAAARKTAKTDCGGSSAWVDSLVASVKIKRDGEKGGNGAMVTEHRQIGRILRLKGVPIGTQFNLFAVPEEPATDADGAPAPGMDAELQGQHAYSNGEKPENNPFQAGTAEHQDWSVGYYNAQSANARSMGGDTEAAQH